MSTPDLIIIEVPQAIDAVVVSVASAIDAVTIDRPGDQGPIGPRGPGIFPSATPPENPIVGDIWLDISAA